MKMMTNLDALNDFVKELRQTLPQPSMEHRKIVVRPNDALYNVWKRSVPPKINTPLVLGLLRKEADEEVLRYIHKEEKRRNSDPTTEIHYYFDIVPIDAAKQELSIYYNEGSPIQ